MIMRPTGGASANRNAPGAFSSERRWPGGDGADDTAAGSVLRHDFRVPLEAPTG
jgi:hypothetical protein